LEVTAERVAGEDSLNLGIVVGGRQCFVVVDGWPWEGRITGLHVLDRSGLENRDDAYFGQVLSDSFDGDAISKDEAAAKYALWKGGAVQVLVNGQPSINVRAPADLPPPSEPGATEPAFTLKAVDWHANIRPAQGDLSRLSGLD